MLVAVSTVAVGAGLFVPGFGALGLGAVLLLLPPKRPEPRHRGPSRVGVRTLLVTAGRATRALARRTAGIGAHAFGQVGRFAGIVARQSGVGAGRAAHGLVATTRTLAREARAASIRLWLSSEPILRRAWAVCRAGSGRAARELSALARAASERASEYIDSRSRPR